MKLQMEGLGSTVRYPQATGAAGRSERSARTAGRSARVKSAAAVVSARTGGNGASVKSAAAVASARTEESSAPVKSAAAVASACTAGTGASVHGAAAVPYRARRVRSSCPVQLAPRPRVTREKAAMRSAGMHSSLSYRLGWAGSSASAMPSSWLRCSCAVRCRWQTSGRSLSMSSRPQVSARPRRARFSHSSIASANPLGTSLSSTSFHFVPVDCHVVGFAVSWPALILSLSCRLVAVAP